MRAEYAAGSRSNCACGVRAKSPILGAGALVLVLSSASAVRAQCTVIGPLASSPSASTVAVAVAGVSASAGALVSSIYSANTAFLNQSNAFIGSPDNPQPDRQGGGVWPRGVGGHLTAGTTPTTPNINSAGPLPLSITCQTRTLSDFTDFQFPPTIASPNT